MQQAPATQNGQCAWQSNFETGKSSAKGVRAATLGDLVAVKPIRLAPWPGSLSEEEMEVFRFGELQLGFFETKLVESKYFLVQSHEMMSGGRQALRFLMGSPRMEHVDEVKRVTTNVVAKHVGLLQTVSDDGIMVAEITFPLTNSVDASMSSASPANHEGHREQQFALVHELEKEVIQESLICLMEKGSDDRSTFNGPQRLNKYFTGMFERPTDLLHRGTCTSSSPTPGALQAAKEMFARACCSESPESDAELMEEVRAAGEELFGRGEGRMVVFPSGTDAESAPLLRAVLASRALARTFHGPDASGSVTSIVACAGEVGSGTTEASSGRFFSVAMPLGGKTSKKGQQLPGLHALANIRAVELVARETSAGGDPRGDYDAAVEEVARTALEADPAAVVVVHTVAGCKTGLCLPSQNVARRLVCEYGRSRVVSVLDACQMRHGSELIPDWLREQGPVLITTSKFYGGPSFGGGVLLPHQDVAEMNTNLMAETNEAIMAIAEASAPYLTSHDIGDILPLIRNALPVGFCNTGLLLRWAAGLHEISGLHRAIAQAGGQNECHAAVRSWVHAMREEAVSYRPYLEYVPAIDYDEKWQLGGVNTIISVRLRSSIDGAPFSAADLKVVYELMHADISERLAEGSTQEEHRIAARRCLVGQPVDIPAGAVLRTCLGAAQLADLLIGAQTLHDMIVDDSTLLAKLALVARQFDHLTLKTSQAQQARL